VGGGTTVSLVTPAVKLGEPTRGQERTAESTLSLLNGFELRCGGLRIDLPMSAQRLLAFVALQERPVLRVYVAGSLWTDAPEDRAAASLRSSLWRLHRPGVQLVDALGAHLRLSARVEVDIRRGLGLAEQLLNGTVDDEGLTSVDRTLEGELLPDWYEDWVLFERERFRQLALHALEALAERQLLAGRLRQALASALAAVRGEPLRESAHRMLIRVHLAEGNGSEALRQYDLCRCLLRDRLGIEPSEELKALVAPLTH
jgi:DNA-binding SARP family transcriptional activator